jgi:tetratricopeptide (TPR) repeat protein
VSEAIEESTAEAPGGSDKPNPAAVALALGRTKRGSKLDAKAEAFLDGQTRLTDIQTEHMHEQRELILSRLRWGRFSDRMKAVLQVLTALVGVAVAGAIAVMAWQAHEDHGLAIQAFSVPPDLAQRGMTGQVVAARVRDVLSQLQADTISARPASTYANDWGDEIKVEIPETGVSLGELNRWLREWLGQETRVSGEVVRTPTGVSVTARAGEAPGKTVPGAEGDIDTLISKAAEAIYAQTQPYRYAVYLASHGHTAEAVAIYRTLAKSGSAEERKWAYTGWATMMMQSGRDADAVAIIDEGMRAGLDLYQTGGMAIQNLSDMNLGRLQASYVNIVLQQKLGRNEGGNQLVSGPVSRQIQVFAIAYLRGDRRLAASAAAALGQYDFEGLSGGLNLREEGAEALVQNHDITRGLREARAAGSDRGPLNMAPLPMLALQQFGDWTALARSAEQLAADEERQGAVSKNTLERGVRPLLAVAYARLGRTDQAKALAATLPLDCEPCLDVRGWVAALAGDPAGADRWFAAAEHMAPDLPYYDSDWGAALLARDEVDGAIAKLGQAHAKGPKFADPLELWGEALMRKGDLDGAIAKFAEADQDAPRWGRNHLMWGEALMLSGRYAEARGQYESANGLDLSKPDRAALDVLLARTARGPLHG